MSKGKGKGGDGSRCESATVDAIIEQVPEVIARAPDNCCSFSGPTAVLVTHAYGDIEETESGFDSFWDSFYDVLRLASDAYDVCVIFTGISQEFNMNRSTTDVLLDVTQAVSQLEEVPVFMTTDPTENLALINAIRVISADPMAPLVGVFHSGYAKILIESIISGLERIPFVGNKDERDYGVLAAAATKDLLGGVAVVPLCLNGRPDLSTIAVRCQSFYEETTILRNVRPVSGLPCSRSSDPEALAQLVADTGVNAVFAHSECCAMATQAVLAARSATNRTVLIGCMDEESMERFPDFTIKAPVTLQAFQVINFMTLPLLQAQSENEGRLDSFFPSLSTQVLTNVFVEKLTPVTDHSEASRV